jgi:hypothetical protein
VRVSFVNIDTGATSDYYITGADSAGGERVPVKDETVVFYEDIDAQGKHYRVTAVHWHYGPLPSDRTVEVYLKERTD